MQITELGSSASRHDVAIQRANKFALSASISLLIYAFGYPRQGSFSWMLLFIRGTKSVPDIRIPMRFRKRNGYFVAMTRQYAISASAGEVPVYSFCEVTSFHCVWISTLLPDSNMRRIAEYTVCRSPMLYKPFWFIKTQRLSRFKSSNVRMPLSYRAFRKSVNCSSCNISASAGSMSVAVSALVSGDAGVGASTGSCTAGVTSSDTDIEPAYSISSGAACLNSR